MFSFCAILTTVLMYSPFLSEGILLSSAKTLRVFNQISLWDAPWKASSIGVLSLGSAVKQGSTLQLARYRLFHLPLHELGTMQHYCFVLISFYLSRCFNARVPKIPKFKKEMDEVLASIVGRSKKLLKQSPPSLVAVEGIILRHRSSAHLNIQGHTKSHRAINFLYTATLNWAYVMGIMKELCSSPTLVPKCWEE